MKIEEFEKLSATRQAEVRSDDVLRHKNILEILAKKLGKMVKAHDETGITFLYNTLGTILLQAMLSVGLMEVEDDPDSEAWGETLQ